MAQVDSEAKVEAEKKSATISDGRKDVIGSSTREQLRSLFGRKYQADSFQIEYMEFEDFLYSRAKKTQIGDQAEMELSLRYQYSSGTFARFRFITDPQDSVLTNKTSQFELIVQHKRGDWLFQFDLNLNTDDDSTSDSDNTSNGSTSVGPDLDSVGTFVSYQMTKKLNFSFFPYNFDGVVGNTFNTGNVTTLFYISGSPSTVDPSQANNEQILRKTIPGLVMTYQLLDNLSFYVGGGLATYLYPTNDTFDVDNSTSLTADSWERRGAFGYKFGGLFSVDHGFIKLEHVSHNESAETGSLLKSATSIYGNYSFGRFIIAGEYTTTEAGERAYRVSGNWFEDNTSPYSPVYADRFGVDHEWLGQTDRAYMFKVGVGVTDEVIPFVQYRNHGENFVYRSFFSAHNLRTFDDSQSHGGLHRIGIGAHIYNGEFQVRPLLEYASADRPVFANSDDVRDDRFNAALRKNDYLASIQVRYSFGEYRQFRPY